MYEKLPFILDEKRTFTAQQKVFAKEENRKMIYRFRSSVTLGVLACFLLNIFWCFYVLQIVPQKAVDASIDVGSALHKYNFTTTLEKCYEDGQISTIPVARIINQYFPSYRWTVFFIDSFVIISITVSFLTLGKGLKHVLDGIATKIGGTQTTASGNVSARLSCTEQMLQILRQGVSTKIFLYISGFGLIVVLALLNPSGFLSILSVFGSFALNVECGIFVSLMAEELRGNIQFNGKFIPVKLSEQTSNGLIKFAKYTFTFAIIYDWLTCGIRFGMSPALWYTIAIVGILIFAFILFKKGIRLSMLSTDKSYKALDDEGVKSDEKSIAAADLDIKTNYETRVGLAYDSPALSVVVQSSQQESPI